MTKSKGYKYRHIPSYVSDNKSVVFLQVIKKPHWQDNPDKGIGYDGDEYYDRHTDGYPSEKKLDVGDVTWTTSKYYQNNKLSENLIIEDNRYATNFDPSCFEVLMTTYKKV